MTLAEITRRAIDSGHGASVEEALTLNNNHTADELADAADRIRMARCGNHVDTCSIINARSGRCTEDCAWCSQAARHHTGVEEYDVVSDQVIDSIADRNDRWGVEHLSLVTSGRKVAPAHIPLFIDKYARLRRHSRSRLCASMGLLGADELKALRAAGVDRYHCNLETSPSYFARLCHSHTQADKLRTIAAAREAGMEVCAGGIIGMGETMRDRLELCATALEAGAVSIPINLLNPIPGTPLEDTPLLGEDEIIRTVALFRIMAPDSVLRFAGGRARLSEQATRRILRGGMNGIMVGDLLTTAGNKVEADYELMRELGLDPSHKAEAHSCQ